MSLLPAFSDDFFLPHRWNHDLDPFSSPRSWSYPSNYYTGYHRCPQMLDQVRDTMNSEFGKTVISKDGYQVCLDVQQFAPNEITVKTVDNNSILVEAKHEERKDEHGYITRQFKRRYDLPKGFNIKDVATQLSSDGILTIKAPPEAKALEEGNVRVLQIQQTGPARLSGGNMESGKIAEKTADVEKESN